MHLFYPQRFITYSVLLAFVHLFFACKEKENEGRGFLMGSIYWPPVKSNDQIIKRGITYALDNSDVLTAQIPWTPYETQFIEDIKWIASLSKEHHRALIINMDWLRDDRKTLRGEGWSFGDEKVKAAFTRSALRACQLYQPQYINLGIEVNFYGLKNPGDFKAFVDLYNHTKKLINDTYPEIKVSTSFQLELLMGQLHGWGAEPSLEVLKAFGDNFDILAISTYPHSNKSEFSNFKSLTKALGWTDKPLGIFETSVPTDLYSETKQVDYLKSLLPFLQKTNRCELIIWTSTIDTEANVREAHWGNYLGLLKVDFTPKPALTEWQAWFNRNHGSKRLGKVQSGPDNRGNALGIK